MVATNFSTLPDGFQFLSLFDQAFAQTMPGTTEDKTSGYTLSPSDNGQNIALGGNALNTLTVGPASGFPSAFAVRIINKDAGRGKVLAINGLTSFILWPLQTLLLFNDNGTWQLSPRVQPWVIPAGTQFNVDNVSGSDSSTNDGLGTGSGAFLTIQHAFSVIQRQTAQIGAGVNIQLPLITSTPITEQLLVSGSMPPGVSTIGIIGNTASPSSCQWQCGTGPAASITDYQSVEFNGIGFLGSGNHAYVIGSQFAILDFQNCDFGANGTGTDVQITENARGNFLSGCSISGNCNIFLQSLSNSSGGLGSTLTVNNTPTVNVFALASGGGEIDVTGLAFTGAGTISGQRFEATQGGIIIGDSGVSWPAGLTAGTATLGGLSDAGTTSLNSLTVPLITAPTASSLLLTVPSGQGFAFNIGNTQYLSLQTSGLTPATDNGLSLGAASVRWSGVFSYFFEINAGYANSAWTTAGIRYINPAVSYTDTSSTGTVALAYTDLFGASTINASTTTVYTAYYGSYFQAPVAGTNVTITAKFALGADSIGATTATITAATITTITAGTVVGSTSVLITGQGGVGYAVGSGGTTTQTTTKATAVTLNKISGEITMVNSALSAATIVSFALTNTSIAASDIMMLNHVSGGTPGSYTLNAQCASGGATINVRNNTAGTLSEAIVLGYVVIKGAIS